MSSTHRSLASKDYVETRESLSSISDLLSIRYNDASSQSAKQSLQSAGNRVNSQATTITAESSITSAQLDEIFVEVSTAMSRYELERASRPDLEVDPRLVGVYLSGAVGHADAALVRSTTEFSLSQLELLDSARTAAELLVVEGLEAVQDEEVQAVYLELQRISDELNSAEY